MKKSSKVFLISLGIIFGSPVAIVLIPFLFLTVIVTLVLNCVIEVKGMKVHKVEQNEQKEQYQRYLEWKEKNANSNTDPKPSAS